MTTATEKSAPDGKGRGWHIVGPAAEGFDEAGQGSQEYQDWSTVRSACVALAKRMNVEVGGVAKVTDRPLAAPSVSGDDDDMKHDRAGRSSAFIEDTLEPPFPFEVLCALGENSSALRQNIDAMSTNIDGFGHQFTPVLDFSSPDVNNQIRDMMIRKALDEREDPVEDLMTLTKAELDELTPSLEEVLETKLLWQRIAAIEKGRVESFFKFINPLKPFTEVRRTTRNSRELLGNAGWEIIREEPGDVSSKICQIHNVPFVNVRLIRADKTPTLTRTRIRKDKIHFEEVEVERFLRRYVRLTGSLRIHYKEFGDPRTVSRETGKFYDSVEDMQSEDNEGPTAVPANELFHWEIESEISAYGIPRWIGALVSVMGSRAAEEVNFLYFDNKAIPPLVLLCSGGRVSEESVTRLESHIEERIKGRQNYHKILVIEGLPAGEEETSGDIEHSGKLRLELKPLLGAQLQDGLFQQYDANNILKIGRSFRQPQILTGDTRDMNRACYSDDTETLTENGWKTVDEIGPSEKIAAYDPEHHRVVFVAPSERHVYEVEDELLYRFETKHTDVLVTAEHKMLMRPYYDRTENEGRWRGVQAKDLTNTRFRFRVSPDPDTWRGSDLAPEFRIPRLDSCTTERKDGHHHDPIDIEDFLQFLGYWISEGSLLQTDDPMSPYWVTLCQKKPAVRDKIQALLDRLPWNYSVQECLDGTTRWKISNKCLRDWLLQNCGGKSSEKRIPDVCMQRSAHHLRILYEALMDGDGTVDPRENRTARTYYTKSTVLADQVQEITLLLGYRTRITPGTRCWRVEHSEHVETALVRDRHVSLIPYTGRVYCFAVPEYGYFVTRRNGKVAIQGNTAEVAKAFAEEQIYQPERTSFDEWVDRHILVNLNIHFWRFTSNAPVQRIPNDLVKNVKQSLDAGAMTPNEGRRLLSDAFSQDFEHREDDWADVPPKLALAAARAGALPSAEPVGDSSETEIESADGDLVARGQSSAEGGTPHTHGYVAVREGDQVRIFVLAGGKDGHTHEAEPVRVVPGAGVTVELSQVTTQGEDSPHGHRVQFQVPLSKRAQRARNWIMALHYMRKEVEEQVEQAKDEYFSQPPSLPTPEADD